MMKAKSIAFTFILLSTITRAQLPLPVIAPDTLFVPAYSYYSPELYFAYDTLPFSEQFSKVIAIHSPGFKIDYTALDTASREVQLSFDFYFLRKNLRLLANTFLADTGLKAIREPFATPVDPSPAIVLDKIKLHWNGLTRSMIFSGDLPVRSIGGIKVNKYIREIVMLERRRSGNVVNIVLNGSGTYFCSFVYANGVMLAYSPDEKFIKSICKTRQSRREKKSEKEQGRYKYTVGSPNERTLIWKKLRRAGEIFPR